MNFYNIGTEKSILASLMSIENSFDIVSSILSIDDFMLDKHKTMYRCIESLYKRGEPTDAVMVHDWLTENKVILAVGEGYIAEILSSSPATLFSLQAHCRRVKELSMNRAIINELEQSKAVMENPDFAADEKLNKIVEGLAAVQDLDKQDGGEPEMISDLFGDFFDKLADAASGKKPPFIPTGFLDLDVKAPIENGDLVIVAARPSMGKTTFVMNIMESMIATQCEIDDNKNIVSRKAGVFFSLEMDKASVVTRFMASQSTVNMSKLRNGNGLDEDDWAAMMRTATLHKDGFPLLIDDRSSLTHQQIRTTLNRLRSKGHDIGVIVIDYLQIMGGIDANNATNSIGEITANLKAIAKEFDCPVIVLSQLNRELEKRPNKRPVNSDLRSSGSIEQDADVIMFIYRDEVYNEKTEDNGVAEIIIGKNRQGEIGTIRLGFEGRHSRFTNFIDMQYQDECA